MVRKRGPFASEASNSSDSCSSDRPVRKKRRTNADGVSFGLRNFHISMETAERQASENWFFMQKPTETFEQIEARLTSDDSDLEEDQMCSMQDHNQTHNGQTCKLELTPEVRRLLDEEKRSTHTPSPWITQPSQQMSVVLWKSRDEILNPSLDKSQSTSSTNEQSAITVTDVSHHSDNQSAAKAHSDYHVSYPVDYESDTADLHLTSLRRKRAHFSENGLKIEDVTDADVDGDGDCMDID